MVRGQTLRCEGLPNIMYSGDRHAMRTGARCHLYLSPPPHGTLPPIIHAVVIRSRKVAQLRAAELRCMDGSFNIRTRQGGSGRGA
eukprot:2566637-Prymnesium_polylepis.1